MSVVGIMTGSGGYRTSSHSMASTGRHRDDTRDPPIRRRVGNATKPGARVSTLAARVELLGNASLLGPSRAS
jgi:hypothetical protein